MAVTDLRGAPLPEKAHSRHPSLSTVHEPPLALMIAPPFRPQTAFHRQRIQALRACCLMLFVPSGGGHARHRPLALNQ